jgi:RHS repeat-associated protein
MSAVRRLWLVACLFSLSLFFSLSVSTPAKADTPTGFQSDMAYMAAKGYVNCSDPHSICYGTFSLLDKVYWVGMTVCQGWTAPPVQCTYPSLFGGTSNKTGYSADPINLAYQSWLKGKEYADRTDPSISNGVAVASTFGPCTLGSTNPDRYSCANTAHRVRWDPKTGVVTYDPDIVLQPIVVTQVQIPACPGYVPGLGCPIAGQVERANPIPCPACPSDPVAAGMVPSGLTNPTVGNPIDILTGAKVERKIDLSWPIEFSRVYSSSRSLSSPRSLGTWSHNHESNVVAVWTNMTNSPNFVAGLTFNLEDGQTIAFKRTSAASLFANAYADQSNYTVGSTGSGWTLTLPTKEVRQYDANGNMVTRTFRNGYTLSYSYSGANKLDQIIDSYGRGIVITWSDYAPVITQVSTIATSSTDTVIYAYSGGSLASATFNAAESVSYSYDASGHLTGITDALGKTHSRYAYNASGQAIMSSALVGGNITNEVDVAYGANSVTVTENGANSVYATVKDATANRTRIASATLGGTGTSYAVAYDFQGRAIGSSVGALNEAYTVDASTFLPLTWRRADNTTTTYTWDLSKRLLTKIVEPSARGSRTINLAYDGYGNLLSRQVVGTVGGTRLWTYTYSTFGKLMTATDPSGAVTAYAYYPDNDSLPERRGQIKTLTNAAGHVITISAYDTRGKPSSILDENNVQTTMSYDARGRMLSKSRAGISVSYGYDLQGQPVSVSYSNGYSMAMAYDDAHRPISLSDSNGESKTFAYDGYGNRIQDSTFKGMNLAIQANRTFTSLRQVKSQWAASAAEATTATYDTNGRMTGATDGLGRASTYSYSNFGATTGYKELDMPGSFGRDADSNMTGYGSGANIPGTSYTWNDFKEMTGTTSPDTGTQTISYDPVARTSTRVDAAAVTHVTTKDALGRVVSTTHASSAGTQSETLSYDANGKGYLASATDNASTQTWAWNSLGLPTSKTQAAFGTNLSLNYGYDGQGQLTSITYPSGMVVGYGWSGGRVTSVTVNGSAYISNIAYFPMSSTPVSWDWAAGGTYLKTIDANGKVTGVSDSGVVSQSLSVDGALRVTSLTDTGLSVTPAYSTGDQLASVNVNGQTQTFAYDVNWNRTAKKYFNGNNEQVASIYKTNMLDYLRMNGGTINRLAYDTRGNVTNNQRGIFAYDQRGNLSQSTVGTTVGTYAYNVFNQRVKKTVGANSTIFLYDESSNLAGEYNASGAMLSEHIYLGSLPIGVKQGGTIYGVHTDYLGTPRVITNGATVVWKWESTDPFGMNAPSVQTITYNPRFPGQYFDAENGLHSNRYRVYDPYLGRYMQSDPIGLAGGKNSYNYVNANPLNGADPLGLYTQIILVRDSWGSIDHIAIRIVDEDTHSSVVFGADPHGYPFISVLYSPGAVEFQGDDVFARRYKDKNSIMLHILTLNTSKKEELALKDYAVEQTKFGTAAGYSIIYGLGVSCTTFADNAMQKIGLPYIGATFASNFYFGAMSSPEYIKRITSVKGPLKYPYF